MAKGTCKNCKQNKHIVNKFFYLCLQCNNIRIHGSKYGKVYKYTRNKKECIRGAPNRLKQRTTTKKLVHKMFFGKVNSKSIQPYILDNLFYKKCFDKSDHKCEECGKNLPRVFLDDNEKVIARWRYSHIIPKSIAPELRHNIDNINHLCFDCHRKWDFGDKVSMKIYNDNKKLFPKFFK